MGLGRRCALTRQEIQSISLHVPNIVYTLTHDLLRAPSPRVFPAASFLMPWYWRCFLQHTFFKEWHDRPMYYIVRWWWLGRRIDKIHYKIPIIVISLFVIYPPILSILIQRCSWSPHSLSETDDLVHYVFFLNSQCMSYCDFIHIALKSLELDNPPVTSNFWMLKSRERIATRDNGLLISRERIAIRENGLSNSRERIAIRENELSNSRERITNPWERVCKIRYNDLLMAFFENVCHDSDPTINIR